MAGSDTTRTTPGPEGDRRELSSDSIDRISLEQALLDVDVANARVIDLTARLTTMSRDLRNATTELQQTRLRTRRVASELKSIKRSSAYQRAVKAEAFVKRARARIGK